MRLLIVEDEYRLADMIRDWLMKEDYEADIVTEENECFLRMLSVSYC